jgi:hypothetical protein
MTSAAKAIARVRWTEVEVPVGKVVVHPVVRQLSAPERAQDRHSPKGAVEEIPFHVGEPMAELEGEVVQNASGEEGQGQLWGDDEPSEEVVDQKDQREEGPVARDVLQILDASRSELLPVEDPMVLEVAPCD